MQDSDGVLDATVVQFAQQHVTTLVAWDVLAFFHHNPDAAVDCSDLAARLGRHVEDIEPEVEALGDAGFLDESGGVLRYSPDEKSRNDVSRFFGYCEDAPSRLALIALVLNRMSEEAS